MANYRGADGIEFVSHGAWSDPELIYDGKSFNYWDIDDALWDMFCEGLREDNGLSVSEIEQNMDKYEPMFDGYVQDIATSYLDDCIFGGYFND